MGQIVALPLIGLLILGVGLELISIAEASGEKVISFAEDMNGALDCAFRGIPIELCSGNLSSVDFKVSANEYGEFLEDLQNK